MPYSIKPTLRQRRVAKILSEDVRKPVSVAMREAGYSPSFSKQPNRLTESSGFLYLINETGLSDSALIKKHRELIESKDQRVAYQAIDMAYKLKGYYRGDTNANLTSFREFIKEVSE